MLQIGICDNNSNYMNKMERIIKEYLLAKNACNFKIAKYNSATSLFLEKNKVKELDALFLEIDFEDTNGIKVAEKVREIKKEMLIVFVTTNRVYIKEGYKVKALRFIIKGEREQLIEESMDAILQETNSCSPEVSYTFINGKKKICVDKIFYIESSKHKVIFNFEKNQTSEYSLYEKLDEIEKDFHGYNFIRIHKSYLVNSIHIDDFSNYRVRLTNGKILPIARTRYMESKKQFMQFTAKLCF